MYTTKKLLFQVKGKNFFLSSFHSKYSLKHQISLANNPFIEIYTYYKPPSQIMIMLVYTNQNVTFPWEKRWFFCLFFVKTTHKRESTLILVQRSAPQCSMMIPIQLQMFASSLALMAQLFVLFLPSLRPLVPRFSAHTGRPKYLLLLLTMGLLKGGGVLRNKRSNRGSLWIIRIT